MSSAGAAEREILRVLEVMLRPRPARPAALPDRLDGLFAELLAPSPDRPAFEIEDAIWGVWNAGPDAEAEAAMERTIAAIAARREREALELADGMVARWPGWAEAWNKRATLRFMLDDDGGSAADIAETLEREPRHFGAMAGLGQICLRRGDERSAMAAFDAALAVNPHLPQIRALRARLGETAPKAN